MNIGIIYWGISAVGGIATHAQMLRDTFREMGHHADVVFCDAAKTRTPGIFVNDEGKPAQRRIRGGDTNILIDAECSHASRQIENTMKWLHDQYDALYPVFICPHPRKGYEEPLFMEVYKRFQGPIVAGVTDGCWTVYSEWGTEVLKHVQGLITASPAYAQPIWDMGQPAIAGVQPFKPQSNVGVARITGEPRNPNPELVWTSQWKGIKGIKLFLPEIPEITNMGVEVNLYSCGIQYYQLRSTREWRLAVGQDLFKRFHGDGEATYHGNVPYAQVPGIYQRAWWAVNLQGHAARSKFPAYRNGAYNLTEIEALYYGCLPILHAQTLKSAIPHHLYKAVSRAGDIPDVVRTTKDIALDQDRQQEAREWVLANHSSEKLCQLILDLMADEKLFKQMERGTV